MNYDESISTFNSLANTWDTKHGYIDKMEGTSERLLSLLPRFLFSGVKVADWGCGTGKVTMTCLYLEKNITVYSVDGASNMLNKLKEKVSKKSLNENQRVIPVCCDLNKEVSEIPDESLDCIFMQQILHHLKKPNEALKQAQKKLKPNGIIIELVPGNELLANVIGKGRKHDSDSLGRFSVEELEKYNKDAGLMPVFTFNDKWKLKFKSTDDFNNFINQNSIVKKFNGYTTKSEDNELTSSNQKELQGNYLTLLVRKTNSLSEYDKTIRTAYTKWSKNYSDYALKKINNRGYSYLDLSNRIIDELSVSNRSKILDIGAGTGLIDKNMIKKFPELKLFGVDISSDMIQNNIIKDKYTKLINADATKLPFPSNSFDGILTTFMLHHSFSIKQITSEMNRVLRPNKRAVIVDFTLDRDNTAFSTLEHSKKEEYGAGVNYYTQEELSSMLKDCGFNVIKVEQVGEKRELNHTLFLVEKRDK